MFQSFGNWFNARFIYIILGLVLLKLIVCFFVEVQYDGDRQVATGLALTWKKNYGTTINPDDYEMARTALYYLKGQGFLADNHYGRPKFRLISKYKTAFRPKFNIALHIAGLQVYNYTHSDTPILSVDSIQPYNSNTVNYMHYFGLLAAILQALVYPASVYCFFKLAIQFLPLVQARLCTLLYCIYPSVFIFMDITVFEKVVTPLIVLVIYHIVSGINTRPSWGKVLFLSLIALLSALMRPHVLAIWLLQVVAYFGIFLYFYISKNCVLPSWGIQVSIFIFLIMGHLPILFIHHEDFGHYFLSSQSSLEFFQGHNPYARGSWYPGIWQEHEEAMNGMFATEPRLPYLNEKQELDFYAKQAKMWILNHPLGELELIVRKTAIYLLPYNFMNHRFNLILLFTHLGVIGFFFYIVPSKIRIWPKLQIISYALVSVPIVACYMLTLMFFVGERWRYYAEPFMLLLAFVFYAELYRIFTLKSRVNRSPSIEQVLK